MSLFTRFQAAWTAFHSGDRPRAGQIAKTTDTRLQIMRCADRLTPQTRKQIGRNPYVYAALRNTADEICGKWNGAAGYAPQSPKEAMLERPPQIHAASASVAHVAQADLLRWNIDHRLKRGWDQVIRALLNARKHGKSVQEILWAWQTDGPFAGHWVIDDMQDCDPDCFAFRYDRLVNEMTGEVNYRRVLLYDPNGNALGGRGVPVPDGKFLVYAFDAEFGNDEGESLLTKLDLFDWYQRNNFIFWMTDLNRYGSPLLVGKAPKNAGDAQREALLAAIDSVQQETGIVISEDETIELLQAQRNGATGFELLNAIIEKIIAIVITGHSAGLTNDEYGSLGQAKVTTAEVRVILLYALATQIDSVINRQLIPAYMRFNFPDETQFPFQQLLLPRADEVSSPITPIMQADTDEPIVPVAFADNSRPPVRAEDRLYDAALAQAFPVFAATWQTPTLAAIQRAERPELAAAQLQTIAPDLRELTDVLTRTLLTASVLGYWQIQQEIAAAPETFDARIENDNEIADMLGTPLLIDRAREIALSKHIIVKRAFERLEAQAKRQAFTVSGVMSERVMAQVRQSVADAIADGATARELEEAAVKAFRDAGVVEQVAYHAATVFRTNIQSALHDARWEALQTPEIRAQVALLEYVTEDDVRVRPRHKAMHGIRRPLDDPVWQIWWPPNGFNCRCRIRAISHAEAERLRLTAAATLPPVQPDDGFSNGPGRWQ